MVDAIALSNRAALARKTNAFYSYRKARDILRYNKQRDPRPQGMRDIFIKAGEKKIAELEAEYPDFPKAYERVENDRRS